MVQLSGLDYPSSLYVLYLYLDGSLSWVRGDMESVDSLFKRETMGNERFEVDKAASDESEGFRVLPSQLGKLCLGRDEAYLIGVSVLKLQVNLVC